MEGSRALTCCGEFRVSNERHSVAEINYGVFQRQAENLTSIVLCLGAALMLVVTEGEE